MIHVQKTSCLRVEQNRAFGGYPSMLTLPQGLTPAQMMSWGRGVEVLQGKMNDEQITNYRGLHQRAALTPLGLPCSLSLQQQENSGHENYFCDV